MVSIVGPVAAAACWPRAQLGFVDRWSRLEMSGFHCIGHLTIEVMEPTESVDPVSLACIV